MHIENPDTKAIMRFLEEKHFSAGLIASLKVKYRALICPYQSLIKKVEHGERVADVGCGNGQLLLLLSKFAYPSYFFGIEIKPKWIENANHLFEKFGHHRYKFEVYDGEHFPIELEDMDVIFLVDVLHHIPANKLNTFLKNLSEKIRPGARLVLKDFNAANPLVVFNKMHDFVFSGKIGNEISVRKACELLQQNGFDIIEQETKRMYVYPHYILTAKKR